MPVEIIAAIIGAFAVIIAAVITVRFKRQKQKSDSASHQSVIIGGNKNEVTQETQSNNALTQSTEVEGDSNKIEQKIR